MITIETLAGTSVNVEEPKRNDFPYNLNGALQYTLAHHVYKILDIMGVGIGRFLGSALVEFLDIIKPELVTYVSPMLTELLENPKLPDGLRTMLESIQGESGQAASTLLMGLGSTVGGAALGSVVNTLMSPATYWLNDQMNPARVAPREAYTMYWRGLLSEDELNRQLRDQGWGEKLMANWQKVLQPRFDIGMLINLMRRGLVSRDAIRAELINRGYKEGATQLLFDGLNPIPPPGDLVSMAVREAFHPDLIAKYHYLDNFPPEFATWMNKQGYTTDWAQKYWVAHWRLPSIGNAFQMLHRGEINLDEMRDLLRTADIAPIWHDPLIQIAYSPYTRVDVRRMHKLGVLDDAALIKSYMDLGYNRNRAVKMAQFTILYNQGAERDTTKSELLKGYGLGILNQQQAISSLVSLGYPNDTAQYYIALEDYKAAQSRINDELGRIKTLFMSSVNTRSEVIGLLGQLEITSERMNKTLYQWTLEKKGKISRPTKSELNQFVKRGIIGFPAYTDQLRKRFYTDSAIIWYKQNLLIDMQEETNKAEEDAAKELERIQQAAESTYYQKERASINYYITVAQCNLVECAYMMEQAETPEGAQMFRDEWWNYKRQIAYLKADRANLALAQKG